MIELQNNLSQTVYQDRKSKENPRDISNRIQRKETKKRKIK